MLAAIAALAGLGIWQRWGWMVVPTWITAIATLGLFAGAVVTAFYAVKTFAAQSEELRDQRASNLSWATIWP